MKTVLIISYSQLYTDPRILRQIQAIRQDYIIATIGYAQIKDDTIIFYPVNKPERKSFCRKIYLLLCLLLSYKTYEKYSLEKGLDLNNILFQKITTPDVIIANDWNALYLASLLKSKNNWRAKIYFDAHEYSPREFDNSIKWRLLMQPIIIKVLKKCKDDISIMSTVCDGIAREYERFFKFPEGFIRIVTNAAVYNDFLKPSAVVGGVIKLIHHGGAIKERRLELMIKMMRFLEPQKYDLTFMLVPLDKKYYIYLVNLAIKYTNIHFVSPVRFDKITQTLNSYDIGVYILIPNNFNNKYALPNKIFEFIQARLAVAIGPSLEMTKIVDCYNVGIHSDEFTPKSLANSIAGITHEKIIEYKGNADKYAKELSAEENIIKIKNIVAELAGD